MSTLRPKFEQPKDQELIQINLHYQFRYLFIEFLNCSTKIERLLFHTVNSRLSHMIFLRTYYNITRKRDEKTTTNLKIQKMYFETLDNCRRHGASQAFVFEMIGRCISCRHIYYFSKVPIFHPTN